VKDAILQVTPIQACFENGGHGRLPVWVVLEGKIGATIFCRQMGMFCTDFEMVCVKTWHVLAFLHLFWAK